jgi:tRNA pseudouridine65 synthase
MGRAQEEGSVNKRYLALVRGPAPEHMVVDHPIPRRPGGPRVPAVTEIRLLGRFERYSLVEACPRTGRLHQIRRHLKHLSLPIIGDTKYGKSEHNHLLAERFELRRMALHAIEMELDHPLTGERLHLAAPLPEDLARPLRAMGLVPEQ